MNPGRALDRTVIDEDRSRLTRLRWAVRGALLLGMAASISANILHADPNPISQAIAAWPAVALLMTVELIVRVPVSQPVITVVRLAATTAVACIAAWISYWHMAGVAMHYGETSPTPYLLPISVDGLILIASVSLIELTNRIRDLDAPPSDMHTPTGIQTQQVPVEHRATDDDGDEARPSVDSEPEEPAAHRRDPRPDVAADDPPDPETRPHPPTRSVAAAAPRRPVTRELSDERRKSRTTPRPRPAAGAGTVPADTAQAVAYWRHQRPDLSAAEIGRRIGKSERTVYRHWPSTAREPAAISA